MNLYFVRHGRAEDRMQWDPVRDHLRPLTQDGMDRMRKSAHTMQLLGLRPDVILTSPLVRAVQTAEIIANILACDLVETELLAGFGVGGLSDLIDAYPAASSLMLVGHEPDFSTVVQMITGGSNVVVKKGSLIRVDLYATNPPRGQLVWSIPPKALVL